MFGLPHEAFLTSEAFSEGGSEVWRAVVDIVATKIHDDQHLRIALTTTKP